MSENGAWERIYQYSENERWGKAWEPSSCVGGQCAVHTIQVSSSVGMSAWKNCSVV